MITRSGGAWVSDGEDREGGTAPGTMNEEASLSGRTRTHSPRPPVDLFVPEGQHTCTRQEYYEAKEATT